MRNKNIWYPILLLAMVFVVWKYRESKNIPMVAFSGKTMGPITYNIKYFDSEGRNFQKEVDSLLEAFNECLNTYRPESDISIFNRDTSFQFRGPYFLPVLERSREIFKNTNGYFDPTVMPLVNAFGFGPGKGVVPDSAKVDSLMTLVGFEWIDFDQDKVRKKKPGVQLDFSAIAKGQGVDVVGDFLMAQGIKHILVDIGGELRTYGKNVLGKAPWSLGVVHPFSDPLDSKPIASITMGDEAMATSGNYRNYVEVNGIKYSHTLDPKTGWPVQLPILSATVIASDCMTADAYATAFMVMGHEKAIELLEKEEDLEGFIIFTTPEGAISTYTTTGLQDRIKIFE